jgi:hypothetical protein
MLLEALAAGSGQEAGAVLGAGAGAWHAKGTRCKGLLCQTQHLSAPLPFGGVGPIFSERRNTLQCCKPLAEDQSLRSVEVDRGTAQVASR